MNTANHSARSTAARVVSQVLSGHSLSEVLPPALMHLPAKDRGFTQELCYGTLRWGPRLDFITARLLSKPLRERDKDVRALIWVGLYQLLFTRVAAYGAVDGTVAASRDLGKPWAAGLINAVMRGFQRQREALLAAVEDDEEAATAHPAWWLACLRQARPDHWRAIVAANNERPPMALRVNARYVGRDEYLQQLAGVGIASHVAPHTECGIVLESPVDVTQLPGFDTGQVSVQDGAAQLVAQILDSRPGDRVLDACAAPGGKTAHILERQPGLGGMVAVDHDAKRLQRVQENVERLGVSASLVAADAGAVSDWWDGEPFDRILLDAPCSGSGVIRRHPDIKYLRRPTDIPILVSGQQRLMAALWPLLKRGGMLLYATCSILPQENEEQVQTFLDAHEDAREEVLAVNWGQALQHGRLILPGNEGMDGFYYVCLTKR